jgi:hypothetical protein
VPATLARNFLAAQPGGSCAEIVPVEEAGHLRGWAEQWPALLRHPFPGRKFKP